MIVQLNRSGLGFVLGAFGFWFFQQHPEVQTNTRVSASQASAAVSEAASNVTVALRAKFEALDLSPDKIREEISRTGQIFRRKAEDIGEQMTGSASDAKAVAEIKGKLAQDPALSAQNISAACDHGHVTLSGTVSSADDVGKAVTLALETGGVRDVKSTLQINNSKNAH